MVVSVYYSIVSLNILQIMILRCIKSTSCSPRVSKINKDGADCKRQRRTLGSPEINGNIFFLMNMYIHICIVYACAMNCTQSPTVLITHGQPS